MSEPFIARERECAELQLNIAVAFIIDIVLTTFFFIEPFILYVQFYLSGKFFVESLKKIK